MSLLFVSAISLFGFEAVYGSHAELTGIGAYVEVADDGSRRLISAVDGISKYASEHGRSLLDDCPFCPGVDWTCGDTIYFCHTQLNDGWECACDVDTEGNDVCWQNQACSAVTPCTTNSDCSSDSVCVTNCCTGGNCFPKCQFPLDDALEEDCGFICADKCDPLTSEFGCSGDQCTLNCRFCEDGYDPHACQCHNNGCNQCNEGYFKVDYDFPCQECPDNCDVCTDFYGCQQCSQGYVLVEDPDCGEDSIHNTGNTKVHFCVEQEIPNCPNYDDTNYNTCYDDEHCSNCQQWGCAECDAGYYKMGNFKRCQSCSDNYPNCNQCTDWQGCTTCNYGYSLQHITECADEVCVGN